MKLYRLALASGAACLAMSAAAQTSTSKDYLPLRANTQIMPGKKYYTIDEAYYLTLDTSDGFVKVVDTSGTTPKETWNSSSVTGGAGGATDYVMFEGITNFSIKPDPESYRWDAYNKSPNDINLSTTAPAFLDVSRTGNLVIVYGSMDQWIPNTLEFENFFTTVWSSDGTRDDETSTLEYFVDEVSKCSEQLSIVQARIETFKDIPRKKTTPATKSPKRMQQHWDRLDAAVNDFSNKASKGSTISAKAQCTKLADTLSKHDPDFSRRWKLAFTDSYLIDDDSSANSGLNPDALRARWRNREDENSIIPARYRRDLVRSKMLLQSQICKYFVSKWDKCLAIRGSKVRILGSSKVSDAVMVETAIIYGDVLRRIKEPDGKTKVLSNSASEFKDFTVILTNGEPYESIQTGFVPAVQTISAGRNGYPAGYYRGSASNKMIWLTEQLYCKSGFETRNELLEAVKKHNAELPSNNAKIPEWAIDDIYRTQDLPLHELGHSIDFVMGLNTSDDKRFRVQFKDMSNQDLDSMIKATPAPANLDALVSERAQRAERFAFDVQGYFGAPSNYVIPPARKVFMEAIMDEPAKNVFECFPYNDALKRE